MSTLSHLSSTTKLVSPMRPGFDQHRFVERKELLAANGNNVVIRKEYQVDTALNLSDFTPFLSLWKQNRKPRRLPAVADFDGTRSASSITAVHLVDTSSNDAIGFRYLEFDRGSRMDGQDFSGIQVADYPEEAIRQSTLIDYEAAARVRRCSLMEVSIKSDGPPRKYARLILPVSEKGTNKADRLLVVVRLLECDQILHRPEPGVSGRWSEIDHAPATLASGRTAESTSLAGSRRPRGSQDPSSYVLRDFFHSGQQESLDDNHLLELLLMRSLPAEAARDLAIRLVAEFGSIAAATAMSNERLAEIRGLSNDLVVDLKVVRELAARMIRKELSNKDLMSDTRKVIDYCHARMAHETVEHVRLIYLDQKNQLIKDETVHGGSVSVVPVHPRQIVKRAILLDAQSIILAHNHPSGDPSPSAADVELTLELKRCAQAVGIRLLDHLVIGRSGHVSLRSMGYLDLDSG